VGRTARRVVIPAWRDGGQAQYIEHDGPADANHPLQPTIAWMEENALAALDLQAIANHASVSVRTLNRQFREHFGTTPLELLARMRVDRATGTDAPTRKSTALSMARTSHSVAIWPLALDPARGKLVGDDPGMRTVTARKAS
jgi:transcriptional regulator GlxA family with amidase domain